METAANNRNHQTRRVVLAAVILMAVLTYTASVIGGLIPKSRQLDATHVTLLAIAVGLCAVILRPTSLDRLSRLEGMGFKVELLERIQERQAQQAEELYRVDLIVPLLFRDGERKHLNNLLRGATTGYHGGSAVRDELRRLRAIGLVRSLPDRHVSDLHTETEFDLAEWVNLTAFGRYWAERLERLGAASVAPLLPESESRQQITNNAMLTK